MLSSQITARLESLHQFFSNTTECLAEEDSKFAPKESMHTVAQHVAEAAHTIDWFLEGAFGDKCFDLDFEAGHKKIMGFRSLTKARKLLKKAIDRAVKAVEGKTDEELLKFLPVQISHAGPANRNCFLGYHRPHSPPPGCPGCLRPPARQNAQNSLSGRMKEERIIQNKSGFSRKS